MFALRNGEKPLPPPGVVNTGLGCRRQSLQPSMGTSIRAGLVPKGQEMMGPCPRDAALRLGRAPPIEKLLKEVWPQTIQGGKAPRTLISPPGQAESLLQLGRKTQGGKGLPSPLAAVGAGGEGWGVQVSVRRPSPYPRSLGRVLWGSSEKAWLGEAGGA